MGAPLHRTATATVRRMVLLQVAVLCLLAVGATMAATLLVLRKPLPAAQPDAAPVPMPVEPAVQRPPGAAQPLSDSEVLVIVPQPGETELHLPGSISRGTPTTVTIAREPPPIPPTESPAELRAKIERVFPWEWNDESRSAPKVFRGEQAVYIAAGAGDVHALDLQGRERWHCNVADTDIRSIVEVDGTAVCQSRRQVAGLRAGKVAWTYPLPGEPKGLTPTPDGVVVTWDVEHSAPPPDGAGTADAVMLLDARTGETRWHAALNGPPSGPAAVGPRGEVYVTCEFGFNREPPNLYAFSSKGKLLWSDVIQDERGNPEALQPPLVGPDGRVYVAPDDGSGPVDLLCYTANGKLAWRKPLRVRYLQRIGLTFGKGVVYVAGSAGCNIGDEHIFALEPRSGKERWRYRLNSAPHCPLALGPDGTLYCAAHNRLHAIDAQGQARWQHEHMWVSPQRLVPLPDRILALASGMEAYTLDGRQIEAASLRLPHGFHFQAWDGRRYYASSKELGVRAVEP
jgi:outer membrane protein assembly factor BamB